ncbi:lmo0937 family membrane protein (plasmid) [Priestia megaterium]
MSWTIIFILLICLILGMIFQIGGGVIQLLLIMAVIAFIFRFIGRRIS